MAYLFFMSELLPNFTDFMQTYINFGFRFSASLEYKGSDQISEAKTPFLGLQQIFKKLDEVNYPKFGMDVLNKRLLKIECVKGPLTTMYKLFRKFQTGGWFSLQSTTKMFPQPNTFTGVEKIMVQVLGILNGLVTPPENQKLSWKCLECT